MLTVPRVNKLFGLRSLHASGGFVNKFSWTWLRQLTFLDDVLYHLLITRAVKQPRARTPKCGWESPSIGDARQGEVPFSLRLAAVRLALRAAAYKSLRKRFQLSIHVFLIQIILNLTCV